MTTFPMRAASAALIFSAALFPSAALADPSQALALAKQQITANDCGAAVRTLQDGIRDAAALTEQNKREAALAALHFYSALAQSNCAQQDQAKSHLREFFALQKGQSSLDASKYPRAFVTLFDSVQRGADEMFGRFYPGFDEHAPAAEEPLPIALWTTSPAFQILADDAEREEWGRLGGDEARSAFIERFWKRRDPDPATADNELRRAVVRRVAFADEHFKVSDELRGAMSDRGRVFVLLGPPSRVRRQALQRYETTIAAPRTRTPLTGTMERWVYFPGQLPALAVTQVEFQFITHPGYGEYVMQREFWPLKAMDAARQPRGE
jgi:GWxTD domain-containing protein